MSHRERESNLQLRKMGYFVLQPECIGGDSSNLRTYLSRRLSCRYFISGDNR
jgi:hypothetical protein